MDMKQELGKSKKGVESLEGLAYGILIVAIVIIVGIYLITQVGSVINMSDPTVASTYNNVTFAFSQMAILLAVVVLVGVLAVIITMLRGGFQGGARQGM